MNKASKRTGIVQDPRYADHCTDPDNPECPDRVTALYTMLQAPDMRENFTDIAPGPADEEDLLLVHTADYIRRLERTRGRDRTSLDPDTQTSSFSYDTALLAVGGFCRAIELVHAGKLDNAMALVRPPGHHAERSKAMGFCLYNNVAVGVRYAQNRLGLGRILVVDWDLHHGNGTQSCFEDDPSVLYFSIHQFASYPGGGKFKEIGKGPGEGRTVNIPLRAGCGDAEYVSIFEQILRPMALEFEPELILVSAGFDIHQSDPLGGMRVTPRGFAGLTRSILTTADNCCGGKVVMTLEGGYNLAGLRDSVKAVLQELAGLQATDIKDIAAGVDAKILGYLIWQVRRNHGRYWKSLKPAAQEDADWQPSIAERLKETTARIVEYLKS
jgi:acetoin utilization deacetylase AcuC-like enzyme